MQTRRADRQQQQQETTSPMSVVTPSAAQAPESRVDRDRRERGREHKRDPIVPSSDDAVAHTPRSRPAHPATAAARQPTPPASLARSRAPPMSPNATGGSSASSTRSAGSAAAGNGNGNGSGTSAAADKKSNDKWVESVDYAYEYVPVAQKREGRKNISYELIMRQQPLQARMCGVGEKSDRRPVDPTPIIQLKVMTSDGEDVTPLDPRHEKSQRRQSPGAGNMLFMQNPYYFLFACLVGGDDQDAELHVIDDGRTRFLTGTPVSSLYHLKDIDNKDAAFFVFPDLGVRKEGRYKLKLTLFEIVDQEVYYCTTLLTETFSVYSAKKFPGMSKATELSRAFADQGLKIRVRKDPRPARTKDKERKRKNSAASEEDDVYGKRQRHATHPGYPVETRGYAPEGHYATYPPPPNGYAYAPGYQHQQMPPPPPPAFEGYRPGSAGAPSPHHGHHPNMPPQGPYSPPYYAPSYGYQRPRNTLPPNYGPDPYYQSGPPPPTAGPYDPRWDMRGGDPRDPREMREREMREREMHEHEMREREMREREMGRDPRDMQMRDPRDDPRYARDPRDYPQRPPSPPREYDPRDMYPRDPRDMDPRYARDPREPPRDPREMRDDPRDPRGFYNREPRGSPLYHTPPRSAGAVLSPASVLPGDRDHRPTTAPARGPPGPPPMRLPPLGSRVDAPPSLGAYPRERERRDDLSRPGSGWSGSGSGSRGHTHPGDRSPDTPGGSTKPTGRMGVGHLVD